MGSEEIKGVVRECARKIIDMVRRHIGAILWKTSDYKKEKERCSASNITKASNYSNYASRRIGMILPDETATTPTSTILAGDIS